MRRSDESNRLGAGDVHGARAGSSTEQSSSNSGNGNLNEQVAAGRRPLWQRVKRPESYWPTRCTRQAPFWHPWHLGAAWMRLRIRWWGWKERRFDY